MIGFRHYHPIIRTVIFLINTGCVLCTFIDQQRLALSSEATGHDDFVWSNSFLSHQGGYIRLSTQRLGYSLICEFFFSLQDS